MLALVQNGSNDDGTKTAGHCYAVNFLEHLVDAIKVLIISRTKVIVITLAIPDIITIFGMKIVVDTVPVWGGGYSEGDSAIFTLGHLLR